MHDFDLPDIRGTICAWEPWHKRLVLAAAIALLVFGIGFYLWFMLFVNVPTAILQ